MIIPELDFGFDEPPPKEDKPKIYGRMLHQIGVLASIDQSENGTKFDKQLHILAEIMTEARDHIDFHIVQELAKTSYGEGSNEAELLISAYDQAKKNGAKITDSQGAFLITLADHGRHITITHALKQDKWPKDTIEEALISAATSSKEYTTRSILGATTAVFSATDLCRIYNDYSDNIGYSVSQHFSSHTSNRISEQYPNISALLQAKQELDQNDLLHPYIQNQLKSKIGKEWQLVSDYEIAKKSSAFDVNITQIFNFKSNKINITNSNKHNSQSQILDFLDFNNQDEIKHAYETLGMLSDATLPPLDFKHPVKSTIKGKTWP